MPDAEWTVASSGGVRTISEQLGAHPSAKPIIRRVQGANNFGVNERFPRFFDEIGLSTDAVEAEAIRARNKAAHGGGFTPHQYQALADHARAYRGLIFRVILKLLDWDQSYVDYSTYGFPARPLAERLGGPEGDGKPAQL